MPFDFAAVNAPYRMQPGLRRLAPGATQLSPNRLGDGALSEKLGILRDHAAQALCIADGFDPTPALHALAAHAAGEHPDAFAIDDAGRWHARHLDWAVDHDDVYGNGPAQIGDVLRALPAAWRGAGLLSLAFAEDYAVIDGAHATIPWLAVCLPSHWAPEDKIGRHFAQVHAPVADNQTLIKAGEHLARLVTGPERWERFVWTITRHAALSQHPTRCDPAPWPAAAGIGARADAQALAAFAYFRTERQTFIPLPEHGQAVFTIHVEMQPLPQAIQSSEQAALVHAALASMSPAVLAYRSLTDARDRLLAWLAARAAA